MVKDFKNFNKLNESLNENYVVVVMLDGGLGYIYMADSKKDADRKAKLLATYIEMASGVEIKTYKESYPYSTMYEMIDVDIEGFECENGYIYSCKCGDFSVDLKRLENL